MRSPKSMVSEKRTDWRIALPLGTIIALLLAMVLILSLGISESRQSSIIWILGLVALLLFSVAIVLVISNNLGRKRRTMAEQLEGILKDSPLLIRIENTNGELLVKSAAYDSEIRDASTEELASLKEIIEASYNVRAPDEKHTWTTHTNNSFPSLLFQ